MTRKVRTALLGLLVVSSVASAALSQDADALIEQGLAMRVAGQDEAALRLFRQAWEVQRTARAQAQIALAEQALGRWVDAEAHLAAALSDSHDAWVHRRRRALQSALAEIRQHVGQLELQANVPAEVLIDGRVAFTLPMAAPQRLQTGPVTFTVRAGGYVSVTRTVTLDSRLPLRETVTLERDEFRPVPPPPSVAGASAGTARGAAPGRSGAQGPRATPPRRVAGYWMIGVGGAALIVSAVFTVINAGAIGAASDATPWSLEPYGAWARFQANENSRRTLSGAEVCDLAEQRVGVDEARVRELCSTTSTTATAALVAGIAGGALAATGLVLALTARPAQAHAARWGVTPWLARGLGGATLHAAW